MEKDFSFIEIAKEVVFEFKTKFDNEKDRDFVNYQLYVSILDDGNIQTSTSPNVLKKGKECLIILAYSSLAVTNYYRWYAIKHIDKNGNIHEGFNSDVWSIEINWIGSWANKQIILKKEGEELYSVGVWSLDNPLEEPFQKLWDFYKIVKNCSSTKNNIKKKNVINSNRKNKNLKQTIHNSNSLNITNNTYNMSKNNIMINLNPKNTNMNLEKLKVEKKLYEYQKLIDKKLNELVKKRNPKTRKDKQYSMYVRRNSSPNIYINNNSQRKKNNNSLLGLENFLRKLKKKNATPNYNFNNIENNNSSISRKIMSNSAIEVIKKKKINKRNNNKSQKMKENKNSSENILNLKQNLNKGSFLSKTKDLSSSKQEFTNDSIIMNGKTNLSLRKYIFSKCYNNQTSNEIK